MISWAFMAVTSGLRGGALDRVENVRIAAAAADVALEARPDFRPVGWGRSCNKPTTAIIMPGVQ